MLLTVGIVINAFHYTEDTLRNAFTNIVVIFAALVTTVPAFAQAVSEVPKDLLDTAREQKDAALDTEADKYAAGNANPSDVGLAALTATTISASAHDSKCMMLTIVSPKGGWDRDLGLVAVSDLAAGARVEVPSLVDEVGFAITILGRKPHIQLTEHMLFGSRVLISGTDLEDFMIKAEKLKYTVFTKEVGCQSALRQEDLRVLAEAVIKARKQLRDAQD